MYLTRENQWYGPIIFTYDIHMKQSQVVLENVLYCTKLDFVQVCNKYMVCEKQNNTMF